MTGLSRVLLELEQGLQVGNLVFTIPDGASGLVVAAAFVMVLLWRSKGVTRGREFRLPGTRRRDVVDDAIAAE